MRKKYLCSCLLAASGCVPWFASAGPYSPAAGQPGSTAISMNDSAITSWATGYENYLPGLNVDAIWQTPSRALGAAQGTSTDIVSLGTGGQITLTFNDPIVNGAGFDFAIFENSFSDTFLEFARVEVSSDGSNYFGFSAFSLTAAPVSAFGNVDPTDVDGLAGKYRQTWGTPFDLDLLTGFAGLDVNAVSYVRLLDVVGDGSQFDDTPVAEGGPFPIYDPYQTTGSAGFDLDAIGVMNSAATVVPLPASIWLFMTGIAALFAVRKNKFV